MKDRIIELLREQDDLEKKKKNFLIFCKFVFKQTFEVDFFEDTKSESSEAIPVKIGTIIAYSYVVEVCFDLLAEPINPAAAYYNTQKIKNQLQFAAQTVGFKHLGFEVSYTSLNPHRYEQYRTKSTFLIDDKGTRVGNLDIVSGW